MTSTVGTNQVISILFNRALDPTTVNSSVVTISPPVSTVAVSVDPNNSSQILIDPQGPNLTSGLQYTVTVGTGLKDTNEIPLLTPYSLVFNCGNPPPTVKTVTPGNSATGIEPNTTVTVVMSSAMDASTINTTNVILETTPGNIAASRNVSLGGDMQTITITPTSNLAFSTAYKVVLNNVKSAASLGDVTQVPNPWDGVTTTPGNVGKFTTGAADTVSTVTPGNSATGIAVNTTVAVLYTANLKSSTVNTTNCKLFVVGGAQVTLTSATLGADNKTITMTPSANLSPSTQYKVVLTGVQDAERGNTIPRPLGWSYPKQ